MFQSDYFFLAVLQGLSEFFPVSSSAHLLLLQYFADFQKEPGAALELFLHFATLLSIVIYYRKKIHTLIKGFLSGEKIARYYCFHLFISCIPVGIIYLFFSDYLELLYNKVLICSLLLCVNGVFLLSNKRLDETGADSKELSWPDALFIGFSQVFALLPGISRSGSTIVAGIMKGLSLQKATEFSFLMSIPLILGGILLKRKDLYVFFDSPQSLLQMFLSFAVAAILGLIALNLLRYIQNKGKFRYFGWYCLILGFFVTIKIIFI